jgi:AhpD family alkylhydroperoxidase
MQQRVNYVKETPGVYKAMLGMHNYLENCGLEEKLLLLVYMRASQINHCAYCLDMHSKDLRAIGVSEQTLYLLEAWREWDGFSDREKAALEWTEAVTQITDGFVPDEVYQSVREHFSDSEVANLTLAVVAINGWNRLNVALRTPAGSYQPKAAHAHS